MIQLTNVSPMIPPDVNKLLEQLVDGVLDQVLFLDSTIEHQAAMNGAPLEQLEGCRALTALILRSIGEGLYGVRSQTHPKIGNYHVDNLTNQIHKLLRERMEDVS